MSRALQLARRGIGLVSPGALVAAVVVKRGEVVGEGFYRYDQRKHAEVIAIEKVGAQAHGASLYVNLEPCSHYGRTPPCTDLIIRSGIRTVVCAMRDPNPLVAGGGFQKLRRAGIEVKAGLEEDEAGRLNEAFVRYIASRRPFVTLKAAMTIDGKIAQARQTRGSATWITSEDSRRRVHEIRHAHDAILVGINTILRDDPLLTDRSGRPRRRKLLRVVLDARLRMPDRSNLIQTASGDVLVICSPDAPRRKLKALERGGVQVVPITGQGTGTLRNLAKPLSWRSILKELGSREIQSLLIEGGGETNGSAMRAGIVDKVHFFIAPRVLGGHEHVSVFGGKGFGSLKSAPRLTGITLERIAEDILITGYPSSIDEI